MRGLSASALLFVAVSASAQTGLTKGDTLRFVQIVKTPGELQMPTGSQQMNLELRSQTILAFLGGDSAVSWVDSITMTPPMPTLGRGAPLDVLRGKRWPLRFLPDGRIQMGDGKPESLGLPGLTQFSNTQWGFMLPRRGVLQRGATWADTVTMRIDTMGTTMRMTGITHYEGDR